ncbi:triphosphoribosyl-dephospho-CoA synthase MdcB [Dechloromonas sp. XY25]|uniref:Probable 2-(5''-triphosphoribosyl)-3'-dephosphocoenzyme-A synthase n=1 Tax=Dechloromonas hankyongensis TaxID=2908002 RepID=A0ABS9JXI8_9RHOO|nr:triphosphoribosyl-dephospho-CoA synthase MdcB [Dechloromonas hankyongensis]MCG2575621.1 triphosphoribosyl-dephospho-CoA synthase MdcB [Dechloromonas hankyongensis]
MLERRLPRYRPAAPAIPADQAAAERIGRLALRSLYREVALAPKPGLVTPASQGSHGDMDFTTFQRSLHSLRPYFPEITVCGLRGPDFATLQSLGIAAEAEMLAATGGINTHRGAIFNLGLLCAAAGWLIAAGETPEAARVCQVVADSWGDDIRAGLASVPATAPLSHGLAVARRYGSGGARAEAAAGFPAAREVGLPAYRAALAATGDEELAEVQALFALIAEVDDTNLLWRGGPAGLAHGRHAAAQFLAAGGVLSDDWRAHAAAIDRDFVARRLSPGGSADLLGVTLFLAGLGG